MNTDKHRWGKVVEGCRVKVAGWLRGKALMPEEVTWRKLLEATEKKWEKIYETACLGRDGLRQRCDQWEQMAGEQRERASKAEGQVETLRKDLLRVCEEGLTLKEKLERVGHERECLKRQGEAWEQRHTELYQRRPSITANSSETQQARKDLERLLVLAGMPESNPIWQTVLSYADEHERTEREAALRPEAYPAGATYPGRAMTDGERHYNVGRAGSAYDFALALRDLWVKAQVEAGKMKGK